MTTTMGARALTTDDLAAARRATLFLLESGLCEPSERSALSAISDRIDARVGELWRIAQRRAERREERRRVNQPRRGVPAS